MNALTRPLVRYHGGKWRLAPWIVGFIPAHRVYVEPYGGGGSVLLRKPRSYGEIYNDLDGEIVNLFRVVRDRGEALVRVLELTPFAREEFLDGWHVSDDPVEQARRTLIRAYMGFGSSAVSSSRLPVKSGRGGATWNRLSRQLEPLRHDAGARLAQLSRLLGGHHRSLARSRHRKSRRPGGVAHAR